MQRERTLHSVQKTKTDCDASLALARSSKLRTEVDSTRSTYRPWQGEKIDEKPHSNANHHEENQFNRRYIRHVHEISLISYARKHDQRKPLYTDPRRVAAAALSISWRATTVAVLVPSAHNIPILAAAATASAGEATKKKGLMMVPTIKAAPPARPIITPSNRGAVVGACPADGTVCSSPWGMEDAAVEGRAVGERELTEDEEGLEDEVVGSSRYFSSPV